MSHVRRLLGVAFVACLLALGATSAPATAAPRVDVVDVPSLKGNIDFARARVNRITKLQARIVLPEGYDAQPERRWPMLMLLHGLSDDSGTWLDPRKGDLLSRIKGLQAIVVLPEGGRGYFTDAWLGGERKGANWERYYLDEVLPTIESRYRIAPGRQNHAIGGLSMGGYGAELLGAQLPSYFGTVLSFSGLHNIEDPWVQSVMPALGGFSYTRLWGRYGADYARVHNPYRMLESNLRSSRLYASVGNGAWGADTPFRLASVTVGALTEWAGLIDADAFAKRARRMQVDLTYRSHTSGLHYWWYWQREVSAAITWGLFPAAITSGPIADPFHTFNYTTMAPHGNAWGLGFQFAELPTAQMVLTRAGQRLSATGKGTVTITPGAAENDASGNGTRADCAFTATLPFTRELPVGC